MSRRSSVILAAVTLVCALGLSGCVTVRVPQTNPSAEATITPVPVETKDGRTRLPDAAQDCAGAPVTVDAAAPEGVLTGDCPSVTVNGADTRVRLTDAVVGELILRGDRLDVDAGTVEALEIDGQDNDVEAQTIGSVSIRGDRNDVSASGRIGSAAVSGNDNEVDAEEIGAVEVSGDGNDVGRD